jgi:hypothetical protein
MVIAPAARNTGVKLLHPTFEKSSQLQRPPFEQVEHRNLDIEFREAHVFQDVPYGWGELTYFGAACERCLEA